MNRKKLAKLHRIYRKIPTVDCDGSCVTTCGNIALSKGEYDHLSKITGKKPQAIGDRCNYLQEGQCSVYNDRPTICRLFGVTEAEGMFCFRCKPEKKLTEKEARKILGEVSTLFNESVGSFVENK